MGWLVVAPPSGMKDVCPSTLELSLSRLKPTAFVEGDRASPVVPTQAPSILLGFVIPEGMHDYMVQWDLAAGPVFAPTFEFVALCLLVHCSLEGQTMPLLAELTLWLWP